MNISEVTALLAPLYANKAMPVFVQQRIDGTAYNVRYAGFSESPTATDADGKWLIIRLTASSGVQRIETAGGLWQSHCVWNNRGIYFNSPPSEAAEPALVTVSGGVLKTVTPTFNANVSTVVAANNPDRLGLILWNNSSNSAYIAFESVASSASPVAIVATFTSWAHPPGAIYTGPVSMIRNAGTGGATAWELRR